MRLLPASAGRVVIHGGAQQRPQNAVGSSIRMQRGWWRACTAGAIVLGALTAGCGNDAQAHELRWSFVFADDALRARAVVLEARVLGSGCAGAEAIYDAELTHGASAPAPPRLARGRYGLDGVARDENCHAYAHGCTEVDLPGAADQMLTIVLEAETERVECPPSACVSGSCIGAMDDGGVTRDAPLVPLDAPPVDGCTPFMEQCNGLDDDCDGEADEDFDLTSSTSHCGACDHACAPGDSCNDGICGREIVDVTTGGAHTCALRASGSVLCWGKNDEGNLGNGTTTSSMSPGSVVGLADATRITAGGEHTCALRSDATVVCWGGNGVGEVGDATTTNRTSPVAVLSLTGVVDVISGGFHTCAVLDTGRIACWGYNNHGQLGVGDVVNRTVPAMVGGITDAVHVTADNGSTCALLRGGTAVCWGVNVEGEVGDGTVGADRVAPGAPVLGVTDAIGVNAGGTFACALLASGAASCWGDNGWGQLGDGTLVAHPSPAAVFGLDDAVALETSYIHSCALRRSGSVSCWGYNGNGNLGDGTLVSRSAPGPTSGITSARAISRGVYHHSCAVTTTGEVWCWGANERGQLGDGTMTDQPLPVRVVGLP